MPTLPERASPAANVDCVVQATLVPGWAALPAGHVTRYSQALRAANPPAGFQSSQASLPAAPIEPPTRETVTTPAAPSDKASAISDADWRRLQAIYQSHQEKPAKTETADQVSVGPSASPPSLQRQAMPAKRVAKSEARWLPRRPSPAAAGSQAEEVHALQKASTQEVAATSDRQGEPRIGADLFQPPVTGPIVEPPLEPARTVSPSDPGPAQLDNTPTQIPGHGVVEINSTQSHSPVDGTPAPQPPPRGQVTHLGSTRSNMPVQLQADGQGRPQPPGPHPAQEPPRPAESAGRMSVPAGHPSPSFGANSERRQEPLSDVNETQPLDSTPSSFAQRDPADDKFLPAYPDLEDRVEAHISSDGESEGAALPSELATQRLPLQAVWPVQQMEATSIEIIQPRQPRPVAPPSPSLMRKASGASETAARQHGPVQEGRGIEPEANQAVAEPDLVETEIGLLPADLWRLVGHATPKHTTPHMPDVASAPPTAHDETALMRAASGTLQPRPEPSLAQEATSLMVQREALTPTQPDRANAIPTASTAEKVEAGPMEPGPTQTLNIDELARRVYGEIRRRLSIEWERVRR